MKHLHLLGLLLLSCPCLLLCAVTPVVAGIRREAEALVKWKASLANADESLGPWSLANSTSLCRWTHITCDLAGHITELDLGGVSLKGTLDEFDFSAFSHMEKLILSYNVLYGTIPAGIGNLTSLVELDISWNWDLRGIIPPSIGQLKHLVVLRMPGFTFNGVLPEEIGNLTRLEELNLQNTNLNGTLDEFDFSGFPHLRKLNLIRNVLYGTIPAGIGNLTSLVELDISWNWDLRGIIPPSIGQLKHLALLRMPGFGINGVLPEEIANLTSLEELDLNSVNLTGSIPPTIGMLVKLQNLNLQVNNLTGSIPLEIGNMTELQALYLGDNYLEGQLPGTISHLTNLWCLELARNQLGGHIFPELGNSSHLEVIDIANNNFSGVFPSSVCGGGTLTLAWARYNGFTSIRQQTFQNCTTLMTIDFTANNIVADIRDYFGDLPLPGRLRVIAFSQNQLYGTLLTDQGEVFICNHPGLNHVDLSHNSLHGGLSKCFWEMPRLTFIDLSSNSFSGVVPFSRTCEDTLKYLHLANNHFEGAFPLALRKCKTLTGLDLGGNNFSGTIPSWISRSLPGLKFLRLSTNMFEGVIPPQILHFQKLWLLDLSRNKLTGPVPDDFTNFTGMAYEHGQGEPASGWYYYQAPQIQIVWKNVEYFYIMLRAGMAGIDLSGNSLSEEIPNGLTALVGLRYLNLSGNHLSGCIPEDIGNLVLLESLDLSGNQLWGEIPPSFADLKSITALNLSSNGLSGRIPTGDQLRTLTDPSIYSNNPGLCGAPLEDCINSSTPTQTEKSLDEDREALWLYCFVVAGFMCGFWLYWGMFIFRSETWRCAFYQYVDNMQAKATKKIYSCMSRFQASVSE
ncbi:leucine-rich repeat receptor protein kinase EMS1-like isoform X1 [Hordeum vulgare subsp. vulgare]|uniref:Leucine-rich repeat-containing N-terminal plant-type domain-containing protein n=1 Tax=Hordeum vulgare subsp. vulgare TaxID=112509 RepID=A0A8I6X5L7_HORVV|nr:leucine-rich repeat receptor protein kinase EMS1-like isoform X1 [Hordeum vulgare subsp. vulgare]